MQFGLQTFPGFANLTISPPCLAGEEMVRKLKKFAMEIAKSTYITLRISLPLLQTLPSFIINLHHLSLFFLLVMNIFEMNVAFVEKFVCGSCKMKILFES